MYTRAPHGWQQITRLCCQTPAFLAKAFLWSYNLTQEQLQFREAGAEKIRLLRDLQEVS
jgi:hypothetical protein